MPVALLVSAARAPQFRRGHVPPPDPSAAELLEELRRLGGVRPEALENPEMVRSILPALCSDTALYRRYVYAEQPPLACPIRAYGGAEDPNITREHLDAWRCQTTASFDMRIFPGGHFFINTDRDAFLGVLAGDLADIGR